MLHRRHHTRRSHTRVSRDVRPRAHRPMRDRGPTARTPSGHRNRCRRIAGCRVVPAGSPIACRSVFGTFRGHYSKPGQSKNPRTIASRSHSPSLVGSTQEKMTPDTPVPSGIACSMSRPPSSPPTQQRSAQGPGITSVRCAQIDNGCFGTSAMGGTGRDPQRNRRCVAPLLGSRRQ
jgi:hypothetical protein